MANSSIVLLGLRGSGKSKIGRLLAERRGCGFVDLDDLTPRKLKCATVAEAWSKHGEAAFRAAEVAALDDVLRAGGTRGVIALGGGTPTAPGAAEMLRAAVDAGRVVLVLLRARPETLRGRLSSADNAHRPSLTGRGMLDEIEVVHAQRMPLYASLAGVVVDVDGASVEETMQAIVAGIAGAE
jgi:shikimate kinase